MLVLMVHQILSKEENMKKPVSKVFIVLVCGILGFLLSYQFKIIIKNTSEEVVLSGDELLSEVESLKKENENLKKNNNTFQEKIRKYEESSSESGDLGVEIHRELSNSRMQLGMEDVKGSGIIIEITPKISMFDSTALSLINDLELAYIVSVLSFNSAEAISINGIRITPQTGIYVSGNFIRVGSSGRIRPESTMEIRAIGNSTEMKKALEFQGFLETVVSTNYSTNIKVSDEISIQKSTETLKSDFMKPIEN